MTCKTQDCTRAPERGRSRCRTCRRTARTTSGTRTLVRESVWETANGKTLTAKRYKYDNKASAESFALRQAQPVNVTVDFGSAVWNVRDDVQVALILPDPQIGYRHIQGGTEAFHCEQALDLAVRLAADLRPDHIVHLGDFLDLAPFSRFAQEPGFANTTQLGIDRGHRFLSELAAVAEDARQYVLEGNHDARIIKTLSKLVPEAALLRAPGAAWPALSVPNLLGLEPLGVEYVESYPAGELWLSERLRLVHGVKVNSSGSTAALVAREAPASTFFGHVHRQELHYRTRPTGRTSETVFACSPGTLARIDGAVPSFHSAVSQRTGRSLPVVEDWQQGLAVASWTGDEEPVVELVRISNGRAVYRGREYVG